MDFAAFTGLFINAFDDPYKGASTFINKKRVYFKKCSLEKLENTNFHSFQAGIIIRKHKDIVYVAVTSEKVEK